MSEWYEKPGAKYRNNWRRIFRNDESDPEPEVVIPRLQPAYAQAIPRCFKRILEELADGNGVVKLKTEAKNDRQTSD